MKIEIETDDIDIMESYDPSPGRRRQLGRMSWLYAGDIVAQIIGETAQKIQIAIRQDMEARLEKAATAKSQA